MAEEGESRCRLLRYPRPSECPRRIGRSQNHHKSGDGAVYSDLPEAIRRGRCSHQGTGWSPEYGRALASNAASDDCRRTTGRHTTRPRRQRSAICRVRSRDDCSQGDRASHIQNHSSGHGVHISYDRMASLLAPYGNRDALSVACDLDARVEDELRQAAA